MQKVNYKLKRNFDYSGINYSAIQTGIIAKFKEIKPRLIASVRIAYEYLRSIASDKEVGVIVSIKMKSEWELKKCK